MIKTEEMEKLPEGWKRVRFKDYVYFQEGPWFNFFDCLKVKRKEFHFEY